MKLGASLLLIVILVIPSGSYAIPEPQISRSDPAAFEAARLEAMTAPICRPPHGSIPRLPTRTSGTGWDMTSARATTLAAGP